ncbi:hypothetical protein [Paraliomyxa miuraensis]|uniref:hypothetical protein n=1 Tax=Paraliomyxa miuraensis TaxID=376150 RepID=UPI002258A41E|nr:hypothetical protein [Paraliomyxa miuraensis]MCX4239461.1 hypothetical protein [Paraliomyxa miuraensis]
MIRVELRPEPPNFEEKVRKPGLRALAELRGAPAPSRPGPKRGVKEVIESKDLPDYWTRCLDDLHEQYRGICAYSCLYIPHVVGSKTTDHFSAKATKVSSRVEDAYEWSNYRLACGLMNSRKGTKTIIDPFEIEEGQEWFQLDLSTMRIFPNPTLSEELRKRIQGTIDDLALDDYDCRRARGNWYQPYLEGKITFSFLEEKCPFLAAEIVRQLGRPPEWWTPGSAVGRQRSE